MSPAKDVTQEALLATVVGVGVTAMTIEEALAEVANFGVFGSMVGGAVGSFFGGPIGAAAGSMIGDFAGSQFTTASIGSSTPIGAMSGGGGGQFPSTFGATATNFGTSSTSFINAFKKYGSVPSMRGPWGTPSTSTNIKIFGSNGLFDTLRNKNKPLRAYLAAYTGRISTNDKRSIGLFVDGFISSSGSVTSGGGVVTTDGCGDTFYNQLVAAIGKASSRNGPMKAVCMAGGFRGVSHWSRPLNHKSLIGLGSSLQPQNRSHLDLCSESCYQMAAVLGSPASRVADQAARRAKARNINYVVFFVLTRKALDLMLRLGYRSVTTLVRFLREEADRYLLEITDSQIRSIIEGVEDGFDLDGAERRDGGLKMVAVMRNPPGTTWPIALGRPKVDVHTSVDTALKITGGDGNADVWVELMQAYLRWGGGENIKRIVWDPSIHHLHIFL